MGPLQIESLLGASVYVPYADYLRNGKTGFQYAIQNYIGGVNGKDVQALVPGRLLLPSSNTELSNPIPNDDALALVGSLGGTTIFVADFNPNNDAYAPIASNPATYTARVKQVIIPNPISGPEVKPEAFDLAFSSTQTPLYTAKTFHTLINQPQILNNGLLCQRNPYYFNETFAEPRLRTGNVTVYGPPAGALPSKLAGRYVGQGGYSASGQMVGYNQESCASAAAKTDPKALQ